MFRWTRPVIFLRSALFNLFFFVSTFVLTFPATVLRFAAPDRLPDYGRFWARTQIGAARLICGIRMTIQGLERVPDGAVILAPRHESAFDILIWLALARSPCFVVKRELTKIPLFGSLITAQDMIAVDREAGASAIRALLRGADTAMKLGKQIIIFPEGTRCDPDEFPPLQPGIVALAARTHLPILPVTADAGSCWGRRAFAKRPGTIHITVHPPLDPALKRDAITDALAALYRRAAGRPPAPA